MMSMMSMMNAYRATQLITSLVRFSGVILSWHRPALLITFPDSCSSAPLSSQHTRSTGVPPRRLSIFKPWTQPLVNAPSKHAPTHSLVCAISIEF